MQLGDRRANVPLSPQPLFEEEPNCILARRRRGGLETEEEGTLWNSVTGEPIFH